jgi:eukaryotic-like serine/threonine-protein kinase
VGVDPDRAPRAAGAEGTDACVTPVPRRAARGILDAVRNRDTPDIDPTAPMRRGPTAPIRRPPAAGPREEPGAATMTLTRDVDVVDPDVVPERVGRYQLQRRIGAGGMGVVWAAHDPELDRPVAIKLMREHRRADVADLRERMRREAQALARLSHANVVSVHDVVADDDRLYVVMQYVDGVGADVWCEQTRRTIDEVVALYVQAARGLGAAHAAGLVHRDVKPSNILVDAAGVARVTDFGLARLAQLAGASVEVNDDALTPLERSITQGAVIGTPAFMAPEQFLAGRITPATDQFGLCAALWHGLTGERPFAGQTFAALREAVVTGAVRSPARPIPRRLLRTLHRGLAVRAADRYPDMAALIVALARPRWTGWIVGGVIAAAIATTATTTAIVVADEPAAAPCAGVAGDVDDRWTPRRRDEVVGALAAIDHPRANQVAHRVATLLDDRAARWRAARLEVCEAARVHAVIAADVEAGRVACLDRSLEQLDAAAARLAQTGDAAGLSHANAVARTGIDPAECVTASPADSPIAPRELIGRVAAIQAASHAGDVQAVLAEAPALLAEVEASGDRELVRDLWGPMAFASQWSSTERARDAGRRAAEAATAVGDDLGATLWWAHSAELAAQGGDFSAVDDLLSMARAAATRSRRDDARRRVVVAEGSVAIERHQLELAITSCRGVVEGVDDPTFTIVREVALQCLGDALVRAERWDDALSWNERLVAEATAHYGADHPTVVQARGRRALIAFERGDRTAARALWAAVLATLELSHGPDSLAVMLLLLDIGNLESEDGGLATPEARAAIERAMAIARQILPADDVQRAGVAWSYANLLSASGDHERAAAVFDESLAIFEARRDDETWARLAVTAADNDARRGRCARARPRLDRIARLAEAEAVSTGVGAVARAVAGACLAETGAIDAGLAELAGAATQLVAAGDLLFAADIEITAAEIEARRGRRAAARALARTARARLPGDSGTEDQLRARADAVLGR